MTHALFISSNPSIKGQKMTYHGDIQPESFLVQPFSKINELIHITIVYINNIL